MNISELVGKKLPEIKKILFSDVVEKFEDVKLVDGTIVRIEPAVEVGATVNVVAEDGSVLPAPDAEHELESGDIIRTEGGLIVEIMTPEAPAEPAPAEAPEEMAAEFDAEGFKADILSAVSELIKSEISKAQFAKISKVTEVEKAIGLITDIVEKMAATPKEEPSKKVANPFNKGIDYNDMVEKMRAVTKK